MALRGKIVPRLFKGLTAAVLGGAGFGAMSAAGYTPGTATDVGLDGSTIRDTLAGAITVGSLFLPQLAPVANIIKSLGNHKAVEAVTNATVTQNERLDTIEARLTLLESKRKR